MKNFNIKQYHQAYHPYNVSNNNSQQHNNQHQHLQNSAINFLNPYTNNNTFVTTPTANQRFIENQNIFNLPTTTAASSIPTTTTIANTNSVGGKRITEEISNNNNRNNLTQTLPTPPPPTLGGYLANQQQQRLQQQQQQQKFNMLSLNQANTFNYNFHFNASGNSNGNNLHMMNVNNRNINHTGSNISSNNINTNNNHNNSALLSRPQRPNTLNISSMASLASTPPSSSCPYSLTSSSSESPSGTNSTGGYSFTPNQFFNNQRENIFNFPITQQPQQQHQQQQQQHNNNNNNNCYNYLQQQQQQYQINYNNYQNHHQQQQHLQQFHLLQQQLKQQQHQQQQQQQIQLNNNCTLNNPPITLTTTSRLPTSLNSVNRGNSATFSTTCSTIVSDAVNNTSNAVAVAVASGANSNSKFQTNNNQNNNSNENSNNENTNNNNCDKLSMDACEIANFLANELFMQQLVSMECMQTGVPTLTTPTLTPTTLKSIEESFIQLTSEPINVPYQAGFIPPPLGSYNASSTTTTNTITTNNDNSTLTTAVPGISPNTTTTLNNVYLGDISTGASLPDYGGHTNDTESENSQGSWTGNHLNEDNSMATTDTSSAATDSFQNGLNGLGVNTLNNSNSSTTNDFSTVQLAALAVATAAKMSNTGNHNNNNTSTSATTTTATPTRRGGGRRPATNSNMTPEEEEKRRIRRERNKLAAARCRKRRVDQTNELTLEVEKLERKREELHKEIESLKGTKQDLEFLLETHRPTCQRVVAQDILSNSTFEGLMPSASTLASDNITGLDTSLATTARCISPLDLKPVLNDQLLAQIKAEPLDSTLDSNSSLDQDGPPSPKRLLLTNNNPMIPPPLPNVATLSASLAAASASLNTPIVTTAPVSFSSMYSNNPTLSSSIIKSNSKQRPNSLPTIPRNLAQNLGLNINDNKPPTDINGVAIQTPSTGMFNFESLMDGGTGLTPVSNPLVPNCSSQNKHPLELVTPTSEPSKLVSL